LRAAKNINLGKEATDETQMKHGHNVQLENPCFIRVRSVAKSRLRPQAALIFFASFVVLDLVAAEGRAASSAA
jgi:hypothetical protein